MTALNSYNFAQKDDFMNHFLLPCNRSVAKSTTKLHWELENVAIANALQLQAARATPVLLRFNYDAMLSLKSLNLSIAAL